MLQLWGKIYICSVERICAAATVASVCLTGHFHSALMSCELGVRGAGTNIDQHWQDKATGLSSFVLKTSEQMLNPSLGNLLLVGG